MGLVILLEALPSALPVWFVGRSAPHFGTFVSRSLAVVWPHRSSGNGIIETAALGQAFSSFGSREDTM